MIECPWCSKQVHLHDDICPECRHEVLLSHFQGESEGDGEYDPLVDEDDIKQSIETKIADSFICAKCKHDECRINEVAMTGTGLSKLLDIQYNHYLFVSCADCAYVEIYDPNILRAKRAGAMGTVFDLFLG